MKTNSIRVRHWVQAFTLLVRMGLGCLFLYSALPKIRQPYDFLHDVYNYEIVGPKVGLLVAMTLPWMELLVAVCLLSGIFVSGALLICVGMAAVFSFVVAWALHQGLDISCGCFGSGTEKITYLTLIRAGIILLLSTAAYLSVAFSLLQTHRRSGHAGNTGHSMPLAGVAVELLP
jgi:uncharacterized membrane protein YphA (DoxX/SURF4 family)